MRVRVREIIWFTKVFSTDAVDLRRDSDYTGRVQYYCKPNSCTVRKTSLRKSNSAEYKFRIITNYGSFTGSPGVTLRSPESSSYSHTGTMLECHSRCRLPAHYSYIWYKNGQEIWLQTPFTYSGYFSPADRHDDYGSPSVYVLNVPSVSVSPSAEIMEGSSVTLTCSSDADSAANHTWNKKNQTLVNKTSGPTFTITDFTAEHNGNYYCEAQNTRGRYRFTVHLTVSGKFPFTSTHCSRTQHQL
uniref:Ig-like domain-containing protein n=1 Tax=Amphiprion percula TaxID=161767 RepID=A0A3P8TVU4_AMPPE